MENNTERDEKRDEKIFNALLNIAADEVLKEEMDGLPSCEELNKLYPRTKSLDKKVNAAINREFKMARRKKAVRTLARIAAAFFVFAAIGAGVLFFDFGDDLSEGNAGPGTGIVFGYIPQGFEPVGAQEYYTFADDAGRQFTVQRTSGDVADDAYENREGLELHALRPSDFDSHQSGELEAREARPLPHRELPHREETTIRREIGGDVITITSYLDYETLAKIIESIETE